MAKRLQRSRTERIIGGVCGGLGEYFNVDPTLVRVLWVIVTLMGGAGILAYLILWIVVPQEPVGPLSPH
jgi:phage shock protein C